jgi:hypothetical protein
MKRISRKQVRGLEVHTYAPELNKLHFKDGSEARCPNIISIDEAIRYVEENNIPRI